LLACETCLAYEWLAYIDLYHNMTGKSIRIDLTLYREGKKNRRKTEPVDAMGATTPALHADES